MELRDVTECDELVGCLQAAGVPRALAVMMAMCEIAEDKYDAYFAPSVGAQGCSGQAINDHLVAD